MKKINISSFVMLFVTMLMVATFSACTFDSEEIPQTGGASGDLVVNLRTSSGNQLHTRAALSTVVATNEAIVKNMVVGIFKSDGTQSKIQEYTSSDLGADASVNGLQQNVSTSYTTATQAVSKIELNDKVLVAVNVPDARLDDFTDADLTYTTFKELSLSAAEAITHTATGTAIAEDAIPMWGEGKVEANGTTFKADITVVRMVAKITLSSLTANFSETLHTNAKFKLTEVFLVNVPNATDMQYTWNNAAGDYTYTFGKIADTGDDVTKYLTGQTKITKADGTEEDLAITPTNNFPASASAVQKELAPAAYIGSGALTTIEPITTGSTAISGYTFYTLPNNSATYNTKLVIKGKYTDVDSLEALADGKGHDAYYAIDLYPDKTNDATDKRILPNYDYQVSAVIRGDGADDAYSAMPKSESILWEVTTKPFDDYQNTVIFNGGVTQEPLAPAKVGDYYWSDGSWSTEYNDNSGTKQVIGIVFSTDVSATDYAAGFTHGYVLALNDVSSSAKFTWGASGETGMGVLNTTNYTALNGTAYAGIDAQAYAIMEDYDGYSHTKYIVENKTLADYPAFNAAYTTYEAAVNAPKSANAGVKFNSSGWYLPSIGQQWKLCSNFCNKTATWPAVAYTTRNETTYRDFYYSGQADITTTNLNKYLLKRLKTDVEAAGGTAVAYTQFIARTSSAGQVYWSSTEFSAAYGFDLNFSYSGNLYFNASHAKSESWFVRPVLAF